jgi:hypothetical protein
MQGRKQFPISHVVFAYETRYRGTVCPCGTHDYLLYRIVVDSTTVVNT